MEIHPTMMLYQLINFIILMVILAIIFNKAIRPFMRKRTAELEKAFLEIEVRKKDAESLNQKYTDQLLEVKQLARTEIDKAVSAGHEIRTQLVQSSQKEAADFLEKARQEITAERLRAVNEIRQEIAKLSILVAEKLIRKSLDTEANHKLVDQFIEELNLTEPRKK